MKLIKTKFFFSEFFNEVEPKSLPKVFNTFYCSFIFKGDIKVIYLWPTSIPNLQIELTGIYFGFDSGHKARSCHRTEDSGEIGCNFSDKRRGQRA